MAQGQGLKIPPEAITTSLDIGSLIKTGPDITIIFLAIEPALALTLDSPGAIITTLAKELDSTPAPEAETTF